MQMYLGHSYGRKFKCRVKQQFLPWGIGNQNTNSLSRKITSAEEAALTSALDDIDRSLNR
jgi:hypothetical protein